MKITIVQTPSNKSNGKYCPWMIEVPAEIVENDKK
jgi:hypothetical protein